MSRTEDGDRTGLGDLRERLDSLDREIVDCLASRRDVVESIIRLKEDTASQLRDTTREEELLARLTALGREKGLDGYFVTRVFHEIIDYSLRKQKEHLIESQSGPMADTVSVGYQGVEGAYSYFAARKYFASYEDRLRLRGFHTFRGLVEHVERGNIDFAVLPVENTTAGSINDAYDLLLTKSVSVVGEEIVPVQHCLMALEDVPLTRIHRVFSHPQALAQCSDFLATLRECSVESFTDTAMAARKVKEDQDLSQAAIASEEAARFYGLQVLKRNLANRRDNYTRFMILSSEQAAYDERIPCKTSLILATGHHEGALVRCLNVLAEHGLSMTKLESRPRPNVPWEYVFYIDFEGNLADDRVQEAIASLKSEAVFVKVLGTYPARTLKSTHPVQVPQVERARADSAAPPPPVLTGKERLSASEEVRRLLEEKPFELASRLHHPEDTVVRIGDVEVGGSDFVVMAGPSSVESREQIDEIARACKEAGAQVLRGGAFQPRTSPYGSQGLGIEGLQYMAEAGRAYGLPIITEVTEPGHVGDVAALAQILQVGSRNMQNFSLLKAVGSVDRPVMLKRGLMASIEEWISAAEYILSHGNQQVILCERGIRTFETATRNTLDISAVAVIKEWTHLPVIVDPSHAVGVWRWIPPLCLAAHTVGAHGLMVEVHDQPDAARTDGMQALRFATFSRMMHDLRQRRAATAPDPG